MKVAIMPLGPLRNASGSGCSASNASCSGPSRMSCMPPSQFHAYCLHEFTQHHQTWAYTSTVLELC